MESFLLREGKKACKLSSSKHLLIVIFPKKFMSTHV